MKYIRNINQKVILILLGVLFINVFSWGINKVYIFNIRKSNAVKINKAVYDLAYQQDMISHDLDLMHGLLKLKYLTNEQLGQIYMLTSTLHYTNNDMTSFFDTVGYALFYSQKSENINDVVYLYVNMAKYFQELGAEAEAASMIKKANSIRSFYECENVFTRLQGLQVYSRVLLEDGDYKGAIRAADQIIADSESEYISSFNSDFKKNYRRSGEVVKALAYVKQMQYENASLLADKLYEKYYSEDEVISQFSAFDFYLPLFYVKTMCAIYNKNYAEVINSLNQYSKYCDLFFFTMHKVKLEKEVMLGLPDSLSREKDRIFRQMSIDAEYFDQVILSDYCNITRDKFVSIIDNLVVKTNADELRIRLLTKWSIDITLILIISLSFIILYTQLQLDGLTRLNNRASLNSRIKRYSFTNKKYSAIMLDIDNFKRLNDTYGHAFGDTVLKSVSKVLRSFEGKGVTAFRYGGEEFVVLLEQNDLDKAIRLSESLRAGIARTHFDNDVRVTASFGIGMVPENPIEQADKNMYKAKASGKNFTAYEKDGKDFLAERRLEIRNSIPKKDEENKGISKN